MAVKAVQHDDMTEDHDDMIIEYGIDISEAEAPDPLPVGEYLAQIRGVSRKTSATSGKDYAAVSFYVSPEEYPADFDPAMAPDGKTLVYRRVSLDTKSPAAAFNMRRFCEAIGAPMSRQVNLNEWINLDARITIEHDEYEGINRENIVRVNPV